MTDREILVNLIAKKLNIREGLMQGIVVPEGVEIETFLTDYKNGIEAATAKNNKSGIEATTSEKEYAQSLLNEFGVNKTTT